MPHEPGHNQITCYDGTQADDYTQCPDISTQWTPAEDVGLGTTGWTPPAWWDDPETISDPDTMNENEFADYIYNLYGGEKGTEGMSLEDFWKTYGEDFPTWEESGFAKKYSNVLEQLGMLNASIGYENKEFNLDLDRLGLRTDATIETALTQKEGLQRQVENQFMGTGGVVSGRAIQATKQASENTNQALSLELKGINIEGDLLENTYTQELINIEDRRIDYENELIGLEDSYENHLINLKNTMNITFTECTDAETKCPDGSCVAAGEECSCAAQNMVTCDDGSCQASDYVCSKMTGKAVPDPDTAIMKPGKECITDNTGNIQCYDPGDYDWAKPTVDKDEDEPWWKEFYEGETLDEGMESMCQREIGENAHWNPENGDCEEWAGGYEWGGDVIEPEACPVGTVFEAGGCYGIDPGTGNPFCTGLCAFGMTAWDLVSGDGPYPWDLQGADYGSETANDAVKVVQTVATVTATSCALCYSGIAPACVACAFSSAFGSDERLKKNINQVGTSPSGINIYEFEFKNEFDPTDTKYRGVMANEMIGHPAVSQDEGGYYKVDYDKIDVNFEEVS